MPHGFEIEREGVDDSDDREKVETRILQPGERVRVRLDLREGVYKLECNVEGHDDLGMEMLLRVAKDAPLARASGGGGRPPRRGTRSRSSPSPTPRSESRSPRAGR
jgi:hypothetical protein